MYGSDGSSVAYPAINCSVSTPHTVVMCRTAAGAGFGLVWILSIGGQSSQSPVTSYKFPLITSVVLLSGTRSRLLLLVEIFALDSCVSDVLVAFATCSFIDHDSNSTT